ncbi:MAG: arginine--tRNA ligase [Aureliella sp.]
MQIFSQLRSRFLEALSGWVDSPEQFAGHVALARDPQHGDYQANIAMPLAKVLGKPPREIAAELVERLEISDLCHPPEIAGPGFINLRLKDEFLAAGMDQLASDSRLGVEAVENPRRFVLDYSAPNVAKPMHVGHVRSTVIGDAIARILRFLGHDVITDNHLGDWGTQFGMIIYGYKHFVDQAAFEQSPVAELSRIYRQVQAVIGYQAAVAKIDAAEQELKLADSRLTEAESLPADDPKRKKAVKAATRSQRSAKENLASLRSKVDAVAADPELLKLAEEHTGLQQRSQLETVKLHEGDEENMSLWKQFLPISIKEIESVYSRLGIEFDHTLGESFYQPMLGDTVKTLQDSGLATESDGAICVFLDDFDAPMIIRKSDGAFLYATTDLATIGYRMKHFKPDAILYVVDHRQGEHFDKLFAVARKQGLEDVELTHVSFGTVLGPDGKPFKTRSGAVIGLEHLLDEAVQRAHAVVCDPERLEKFGLDMTDDEKMAVAQTVGLGAIKYADLSHNRTSDYEFNIEKMVQLDGNTAAYVQYMYARTQNIMLKGETVITPETIRDFPLAIEHPAERALVLNLLQFEDTLLQSTEEYFPNVLTAYLFAVGKQFASFFDQCPVLKAESEEQRKSRLAICYATGRVLKTGLELLGIGVVQRM